MSKAFLYVFVFFTGAAVMIIEMSASRLIAPYFGTSLVVWANIIGLILLAMSAGYFFGGRIADARPSARLLCGVTLTAGLFLSFIPFIAQCIFRALTNGILATPVKTILFSFIGTLCVFAPPVFFLAMVSPFALRLSVSGSGDTGKTAGRLYALSTLGSLAGTFLPSFVLIPLIGTRATIFLAAALLLLLSAYGLRRWWAFLLILWPLLQLFIAPHSVKAAGDVLWEKETPYQYVQVVQASDQSVSLVYNEGGGVQSVYRPDHRLLNGEYYNYYLPLPYLLAKNDPQIWILGSAGGSMLHLFDTWIRPTLPGLSVTGVEIDPEVIPLGQRFFGLNGQESIVNSDARVFLNAQSSSTDLVIVDAYSQQIYIPFHLSTQEFYQSIRRHLNPGGLLAININAVDSASPLLLSFQHTLQQVFPYTYTLPVPGSYNYVLLAADQPITLSAQAPAALAEELVPFWQYYRQHLVETPANDALILTDDRAPVEFLTDQMIWRTLLDLPAAEVPSPVTVTPAPDQALALFEQGHARYIQREFSAALTLFDQALAVDPECYQAMNVKGATLAFQGQYDQGLQLIDASLRLQPDYQHGYFNRGLTLELAERWEESIAAYQQALGMDSRDVWSYYGIASIYGRRGDVERVLEYLRPAIALDPEVKAVAREEHDFAPVASDARYQALIRS
ncbi:MAG: fused MFS/spermidine synthase [Peptococcaceae bacterium]|jgi:spermidine synthase/Tfp pilus assembly protein PilF|nr:fused MFS/spermidine synthase [Peptococcaceae bacterium]